MLMLIPQSKCRSVPFFLSFFLSYFLSFFSFFCLFVRFSNKEEEEEEGFNDYDKKTNQINHVEIVAYQPL